MQPFFLLKNVIQKYEWGSFNGISKLIGIPNEKKEPFAELWMGAHPNGESKILFEGSEITLSSFINKNPNLVLSSKIAIDYNDTLPFLFKILSASKPLSLQVHPTKKQAQEGFNNSNELIKKNYNDQNHKPEIVVPLTRFKAMCGFRSTIEIERLFSLFNIFEFSNIIKQFKSDPNYKNLLKSLLILPSDQQSSICSKVMEQLPKLKESSQDPLVITALDFIKKIQRQYSNDIGMLAPLYLNCLVLEPDEAIYLPAGVLHAYIEGTALELMANSDNVLRAGLTSKHIDINELTSIINNEPYYPSIIKDENNLKLFTYNTPFDEFELTKIMSLSETLSVKIDGPSIAICIKDSMTISVNKNEQKLYKGDSVFISALESELLFSGQGEVYIAHCGNNRVSTSS